MTAQQLPADLSQFGPFESYPQARKLSDAQLCALTSRAMDDDEWLGEFVTCKYCGAEFPRQSQLRKNKLICDECQKVRHDATTYERRGLGQACYVLCIKEHEFYNPGQWYQRQYVYEDMVNGIVTADYFDGATIERAKQSLSEHRISRHAAWHEGL